MSEWMNYISTLLNYPVLSFKDQPITVFEILVVPVWLITILWFYKWVIRRIKSAMRARDKDPNFIQLVERLLNVLALILIFITTLSMLNVPIAAFAFLSGAVAIGFGFGAQNIINNFISGWILIGEKPIRIGDFLEVEDAKGVVEEINTRSTRIRRVDGVHMLIPNSKLLENTVVNWTLRDRLVRTSVRVGVAYGSPVREVANLIMQATTEQPDVLKEPAAIVSFEDFGDNALIFEVNFWLNANVEGGLRLIRSNIRFRLDELFNEHKIVVAYPQRDIHIDGALTINKLS